MVVKCGGRAHTQWRISHRDASRPRKREKFQCGATRRMAYLNENFVSSNESNERNRRRFSSRSLSSIWAASSNVGSRLMVWLWLMDSKRWLFVFWWPYLWTPWQPRVAGSAVRRRQCSFTCFSTKFQVLNWWNRAHVRFLRLKNSLINPNAGHLHPFYSQQQKNDRKPARYESGWFH